MKGKVTMRLGYGLITCERTHGDRRTWADRYREAVELARLCEENGLDSVWTSEHHFVDDGYMPSQAVTGRRLGETIRILRAAWGDEPFGFRGKIFDIERTNVTPKPPRPIPIFV